MSELTAHPADPPVPLAPILKGRLFVLIVLILAGVGLIVAGIIDGVLDRITLKFVVAGAIAGAWIGAPFVFVLLLPRERGMRSETNLGIGYRAANGLIIAAAVFVGTIRDGDLFPVDPIDGIAFATAWAIVVCAYYFDLWIAAPRRLAGIDYNPTKISDGGQTGLLDRGHHLVNWIAPLAVITTLMLVIWLFSGVADIEMAVGLQYGIAIGTVFFVCQLLATRGTYAERVRRHQKFAGRGSAFNVALLTFMWIIGFAATIALAEEIGAGEAFFAMFVALVLGLSAAVVDRWFVTPSKMASPLSG